MAELFSAHASGANPPTKAPTYTVNLELSRQVQDFLARQSESVALFRSWIPLLTITPQEDRGVWVVHVPNAFLQGLMEERLGPIIATYASTFVGREIDVIFLINESLKKTWGLVDELSAEVRTSGQDTAAATLRASLSDEKASLFLTKQSSLHEVNFVRLPFALLWDKEDSTEILLQQTVVRDSMKLVRKWHVLANEKIGMPGPAARMTFRALERVILSRTVHVGKQLTNPQVFTIEEILRELGYRFHSTNCHAVKKHLEQIKALNIRDMGYASIKAPGQNRALPIRQPAVESSSDSALFNLINKVRFKKQTNVDGSVVRENYVEFGSDYVAAVNSGYVMPLNWDLWLELAKVPLAQRLYEVLSLDFYGLLHSPYVVYEYPEWSALMPVRPQSFKSYVERTSEKAHNLLIKHSIISSESKWELADPVWKIRYYPSAKMLSEIADAKERRTAREDQLAMDLAKEFNDKESLGFYKRIVQTVDIQWIHVARSETRMKQSDGRLANPGRYFTGALKKILAERGLQIPFGAAKESDV